MAICNFTWKNDGKDKKVHPQHKCQGTKGHGGFGHRCGLVYQDENGNWRDCQAVRLT